MSKAIVSIGVGTHERLLDIAWPSYEGFAKRHGWDLYRARNIGKARPIPWYKVRALIDLLQNYNEVLFVGADTLVVDGREDLTAPEWAWQAMVEHKTGDGLIPNTDVWLCRKPMIPVLEEVWKNTKWVMHGWWEQASLMDLMGYHVHQPVYLELGTELYRNTYFLDQGWNVHKWHKPPAEHPRIPHATMYDDRVQMMRIWAAQAEEWLNE